MRKIGIWLLILMFFNLIGAFAQPSIWVDTSTGRITVRATREQLKRIEKLIPRFPSYTRQVQIEAKIMEISEQSAREFGTSLERLTGLEVPAGPLGEGSKLEYGPKTLDELEKGMGSLGFTFYRVTAKEKFEAILNMLLTQGKAKLLSSPRVTTISGEVAGIYVTTEVPYLSSITYTTVGGERIPEYHYSYATVGVILQVLPKIIGEDMVQLSIVPIVGNYQISPAFGAEHPIFKRQISPTNVTVRDGESIIIGGLITENKTKTVTGLPILSHLPVVGRLLRSTTEQTERKDLVITVKPHILKPREIKGRVKKIFTFKYALSTEIAEKIRRIVSADGLIQVNPKEAPPNSILIRDREDNMKVIESVLNQIGTFEAQRRQHIFHLTYTSVEEAKDSLQALLSPHGSIKLNKSANSLIVEDGAYQLSQIEKALSSLEENNRVPQKKIFKLTYAQAKQMIPLLKDLLSPQGSLKVKEGNLVVEDNNWVIGRIGERLKKLDTFNSQKKTKAYHLRYIEASKLIELDRFKKAIRDKLTPKAKVKLGPGMNELIVTEVAWKFNEVNKLISDFDIYQPKKLIYPLKYALAKNISKSVEPFLSDKGKIEIDEEKNSLILYDSPYHLSIIKKKLPELDSFEKTKLKERIFLKYMEIKQAREVIRKEKSPQAEILKEDASTNSILLEEAPYGVVRIKEKLKELDTFDRQKVKRLYHLKYTSPKKIVNVLYLFLSDKGELFSQDKAIVVIDCPYHQDKIKQIIKILDTPDNKKASGLPFYRWDAL